MIRSIALRGGLVLAAALLTACAVETVEWQNPQAARELAQRKQMPGSPYLGWRVYQEKCAACHGASGTGTGNAPNLLLRVRDMEPRRFVGLVLQRYDLNQPTVRAGTGKSPAESQIEVIMQRKETALVMPAWQSEPRVNAHVLDLYAYLLARAEDRLGMERPQP